MQRHALLSALLFHLLASVASAQICFGDPSFSAGRVQLSGSADFGQDAQSFGAGITLGSPTAFGGISVGAISYDDLDGSTLVLGAGVGYQVPIATSGRVQLCPWLAGGLGFGPNDIEDTGIDASVRDVVFGVAVGGQLGPDAQVVVIPTASLGFAYSSFKLDGPGGELEDSDTYALASLGAGLVFNSTFSIRPSVTIPFGLEDSDPTFGVSIAIHLGGSR